MTSSAVKPTTPEETQAQAAVFRAEMEARLHLWPDVMPAAMRERPQWLLWRLEWNTQRGQAVKVPYYATGRKRQGTLGGPDDLAALATIDAVLQRFNGSQHWSGIGFAFLADDDLIAIDLDSTYDLETGEVREDHLDIIDACGSYTERSPSGTGVHIICAGRLEDSFKHDPAGIEVYAGGRYFTCTGARVESTPAEVQPLKRFAHKLLWDMVQRSKEAAKAAKAGPAAAAVPAAAPAPRPPAAAGGGSAGEDFKRVNAAALDRLSSWVLELFPRAKRHHFPDAGGETYRVTSRDLGRQLEEDLQLAPRGIMDYGEERGMSPIDVVMRWGGQSTPLAAMQWLASRCGVQLEPPRSRKGTRRPDPPPAPPPEAGPPPADDAPPSDADEAGQRLGELVERDAQERRAAMRLVHDREAADEALQAVGGGERKGGRGKGGRRGRTPSEGEGGALRRLLDNFRLIYGLKAVWDGQRRQVVAVDALRLVYGNDVVKFWLDSPERRLVYQEDILFAPGREVPDHQVNLFDGLEMKPTPCEESEVEVMLELLRHLCSESAPTAEGCEDILHWVLCWLAYPLQNVGAKLKTALVFHGPQGTGKNLFFDAYRSMFGKYGRMVGQNELDDKYNDWLSAKLLIIGNEVVTRQELFHNKNRLKWIITEDEIPIRGMYKDVRWEANHAQVVFLSNEIQPLALEWGDRRYLVIYTPVAESSYLYTRVADFLALGGAEKFLHYLLRYDTSGFEPHTKPPMTEAKQNLISLGLKPAERFVVEWLEGFVPLPMQVCEAGQLYKVFRRWAEMNGERAQFVRQEDFTSTVKRFINERVERDPASGALLEPRLRYKVCAYEPPGGPRTTMRVWIPRGCEAPEGVREGDWAADCRKAFERHVHAYGRVLSEEAEP